MGTWKIWRLVILLALLAGLAWTLINRSPIGRSIAETATINTVYKTEHQWAVRETATEIEKMSAFAESRDARPIANQLPDAPWDPDAFAPLTVESFAGRAAPSVSQHADLHPALTGLDVAALVDASAIASKALESNIRDPRAHESAALVVGAFALRDAADVLTDTRWAMNRMTAHLAVAKALRQSTGGSPDGALAEVILSTLANQQARADAQLAALGTGTPPEPMNAWIRALKMRITQDWRVLPTPASATRVEKLEYFRARRAAVQRRRAEEDLATVGEQVSADFARLAQNAFVGVEDGGMFISPALELELAEARDVYQRLHGRPLPDALPEALNHRASYVIDSKPVVLSWGAWAEFFQRHIAMNIGMVDSHYRYMLGRSSQADEIQQELDRRLGKLTMFAIGTQRRTKGTAATEADLKFLPDVVQLATRAPELLTARSWAWFELGSQYESIPISMPRAVQWFTPPSAKVPYEAGLRTSVRGDARSIDALLNAAPTDVALLVSSAEGAAEDPNVTRARELLAKRDAFDLRAIDVFLKREDDDAARAVLQKKGCELASRDCLALATTLARLGDDDQAAATFERAFADPMIDMVALSGDAGWLIDYYRRRLRIDEAVALAERAASVGSAPGLAARGLLRERLGDFDAAETDLGDIAGRYNTREYLLGFYYRRVEVAHDERYRAKWDKWRTETFPNGLQPEPTSMTETPKTGVFIYEDSPRSRKAGIRAGDIVVGLEGWKVDTQEQYRAINAFFDRPLVKLTLWRGALVKVEAQSPNRLFGTQLRTHPMKGWIQ
jgi:tetratricopeptide (TPR) repeat protein